MAETKEQVMHTPGPWHYDAETMTVRVKEWNGNSFMADYRGSIVADFEQSHGGEGRMKCSGLERLKESIEANAEFIVRAANYHDDLLAALIKYGRHADMCDLSDSGEDARACTCGFDAALALAGRSVG